jgi:1-acyl-sn-glycerol-3-phosphate acyltransferase
MNTYARLAMHMDVLHTAALPAGAKIIAPNHPTTLDPFLVPTYINERVHILVTESAFKAPAFGRYLHTTGHIPVVTGEGHAAFAAAHALLAEDHTVAIFPEGALSPLDGGCHQGRTGVARLAMLTGAAIIPVGIGLQTERIRLLDTGIVNSVGEPEIARVYLNGRYTVTTGAPLYLHGDVEDRAYVRAQTAKLMHHIMTLSNRSLQRITQPVAAYETASI